MHTPKPLVAGWIARLRTAAGAPDLPLAAAAALAAAALGEAVVRAPDGHAGAGRSAATATSLALAVGATVPLAFVRGHVLAVAAAVSTAVLLAPLSGTAPAGAGLVALAAALYLAGERCAPAAALALAVPFVGYAVGAGTAQPGGKPLAVGLLAGTSLALTLGAVRRGRREAAVRVSAGELYAGTLLENAARGERARIARELHDIVAHHISSLSVQAETARLTTPGLPPEGAQRLLAIGETAREALTEMRRLLGVLRDGGDARPARRPQPGLDELLALVDGARGTSAGIVRLTVAGPVRPLDPGAELAAYRIVQEALTNARRHAPGSAVDIELHYGAGELTVRVRDSGSCAAATATPSACGGHGLLGMRERAAAAGGTLHAGPAPTTGFLVEARLPAPGAEPAPPAVEAS